MINWPNDYRALQTAGLVQRLTDRNDALVIWDADFLTALQVESFERLDDQIVDITPFAKTGAGDYWAYLTASLPSPEIVLCYHDSYEAEYFAKDFSNFVFRQTILFAGNEGLSENDGAWSIERAKQMVSHICSSFEGLMLEEMLFALQRIVIADEAHTENGWTTLISAESARQIMEDFDVLDRDEVSFEWRA